MILPFSFSPSHGAKTAHTASISVSTGGMGDMPSESVREREKTMTKKQIFPAQNDLSLYLFVHDSRWEGTMTNDNYEKGENCLVCTLGISFYSLAYLKRKQMKIIVGKVSPWLCPNCFIQLIVMKVREPESFPTSSLKFLRVKTW